MWSAVVCVHTCSQTAKLATAQDMQLDMSGSDLAESVFDEEKSGLWKPDCRTVESITIVYLTTEADNLHCAVMSTSVMSDHIRRLDASVGGGWSKKRASML